MPAMGKDEIDLLAMVNKLIKGEFSLSFSLTHYKLVHRFGKKVPGSTRLLFLLYDCICTIWKKMIWKLHAILVDRKVVTACKKKLF